MNNEGNPLVLIRAPAEISSQYKCERRPKRGAAATTALPAYVTNNIKLLMCSSNVSFFFTRAAPGMSANVLARVSEDPRYELAAEL